MERTATWHMEVFLFEEGDRTRALSGLAHDLFDATVSDIEQNLHQRVQLEA